MYSGTVVRQRFTIAAEKVEAAHAELMKWTEWYREAGSTDIDTVFTSIMSTAKDLHEALHALGWDTIVKDGAVIGLQQHRHDCCGIDHVDAMRRLATYVSVGSELVFFGENEEIFRWRFDGETMHEDMGGEITFERVPPARPRRVN